MMNPRLPVGTAILALTLLSNAAAQGAKLGEEIRFVRELVNDLRFVDMAQYEVEQLKKTYKSSSDFKLVSQLAIEVSLQGAKRHPDRDARRGLYKDALDKSAEFIERYAGEAVSQEARVTLSDACIEFGFFLNEELEIAREDAPDKVEGLEEEAAEVFRQGVAATVKCEEAFEAAGRDSDRFLAWMRRGILQREHGRAVKKDRGYLCETAETTLDDLIFEVGEETILGQKALFEKSKIEEVKGDLDAAVQAYKDAIGAIYESLTDESIDLPESAARLMFNMMQEVYDHLATVTFKAGRTGDVAKIIAEMDKRVEEFQTEPNQDYRDSMLLTQAQVNSGSSKQLEVSDALKSAKAINARHSADFIGLRAKSLIKSILRRSSDLVTGELLLEVARGDFQAKNYDAAIGGFKRALNGMDVATKGRLGFDTWVYIGRSNERLQRYLEATVAYTRALDTYGDAMNAGDDDRARDQLKSTSNKAQSMLRRVMTASNKDPLFQALESKVKSNLEAYNPDVATAGDYSNGLRKRAERKYDEAQKFFFAVNTDYPKYELALGHGILCLFYLKRYDEAMAKIKALREHVKNTELAEDDREGRGYRPQALSWASYTEGRIMYEQAKGTKDQKPDLTKFQGIVKHFLAFEVDHQAHAQPQMAKVHEMLGHAYLEMGDETKATERYSKLKALGRPDAHKALGNLMFNNFRDQVTALETEIAKTGAKTPPATVTKLRQTRQKLLDTGLDIARTVGKPQYGILYNSMRVAEALEAWTKVEAAAEKILKLYGDANYTSLRQVKPLLGYALLRQPGRTQEAFEMLTASEAEYADTRNTTYFEVLHYKALALGGWPAFDDDGINFVAHPGMTKPDEAYTICYSKEYRGFIKSRHPEYTLGWYKWHLELYYWCKRAQPIDSQFTTRATAIFNTAKSTDDFATLKNLGPEGTRIANLFFMIK